MDKGDQNILVFCRRRVSVVPNDGKAKRPSTHNSQLERRKEGREAKLFEVKWQCRGGGLSLSDTDASIRVREGGCTIGVVGLKCL